MSISLTDNGIAACNNGETVYASSANTIWHIGCISGFSLSLTNNGRSVTYGTPGGTYAFTQGVGVAVNDCYNLGEDKTLKCFDYTWDNEIFC